MKTIFFLSVLSAQAFALSDPFTAEITRLSCQDRSGARASVILETTSYMAAILTVENRDFVVQRMDACQGMGCPQGWGRQGVQVAIYPEGHLSRAGNEAELVVNRVYYACRVVR